MGELLRMRSPSGLCPAEVARRHRHSQEVRTNELPFFHTFVSLEQRRLLAAMQEATMAGIALFFQPPWQYPWLRPEFYR